MVLLPVFRFQMQTLKKSKSYITAVMKNAFQAIAAWPKPNSRFHYIVVNKYLLLEKKPFLSIIIDDVFSGVCE